MCRWLAYSGSPVALDELLFKPKNAIVVQSKQSRMGAEAVNGDGFGVGWYAEGHDRPGIFRSIEPAWNDANLAELARMATAGRVFMHIRAAIGSPVQQSNCHPFRRGRWLFMHNGYIAGFRTIKRDLVMAVAPELFPEILGSTDTEVLFYLALTMGLEKDPHGAVERAVGIIEATGRKRGIENPIQGTFATTNGDTTWVFRYSSEHRSRSLFHSTDVSTLREQYPDNPVLHKLSDDTRIVVSEPLGDLKGAWKEVAESTCLVVRGAKIEHVPFAPRA